MRTNNFEDMVIAQNKECQFFQSTITSNLYDIILDEDIKAPDYYRNVFQIFRQASPGDTIRLNLNSCGGYLSTAICFINLMKETQAQVVAVLEGETHSAASLIALNADGIEVKPYASMMIHHASFGSGGTVQNVVDHVNFTSKQTEKLMRETYADFLTAPEIEEVIRNREIWLTDEEIGERLERMFEVRASQGCGDPDCEECGFAEESELTQAEIDALLAEPKDVAPKKSRKKS